MIAAAEVLLSIAAATAAVAALDLVSPITGLSVVYLPAVLLVAVRRGQVAALATALVSVLAFNFFFIEPRYRLEVAHPEHVIALVVFFIAAVVVGRLAASARDQAREAEARATVADSRERESKLLADAASLMLVGGSVQGELDRIGEALAKLAGGSVRLELSAVPSPRPNETTGRLPLSQEPGWLHAEQGADQALLGRLSEPLARLLDVGLERRRIAEREADSEARVHADATKTAVLQAVSHDLRSPLTAIVTAASALRSPGVSPEERQELLSVVDAEATRLGRLVDDLLDLSRIEAGAVEPRLDWCDVRDVVAGAAEQAQASRGEHPIEIQLPEELPLVRADSVQLERVFFNLIDNAIKFSPEGAPISITGAAGGGGVTVRVRDLGKGIPSSRHAQVFEPFFQGRNGQKGSGLGLAICRGLVEANGGRIAVNSRKGEGTAFAVTLPAAGGGPSTRD